MNPPSLQVSPSPGLPSQFRPLTLDSFIGPARAEAGLIAKLIQLSLANGAPQKWLILGPPGIGKSALSNFIVHAYGGTRWTTARFNGKQMGLDQMEQLAHDYHFTSLFDGFRVVQIEEADRITKDAQVRFLTFLDDLPKFTAVVCTSNCSESEFEERFQRRFKVVNLLPPGPGDIEALLLKLGTPPAAARHISIMACGNVGLALEDADTAVADTITLKAA